MKMCNVSLSIHYFQFDRILAFSVHKKFTYSNVL